MSATGDKGKVKEVFDEEGKKGRLLRRVHAATAASPLGQALVGRRSFATG